MTSEIQVFARLPRNITQVSDPASESTDWHWVPCLKFTFERFNSLGLSVHPYKWVRYAMSVVVGAKGDLSSNAESLEIIDYSAKSLTEELATLYYHCSNEERQRMYPIDPNLVRMSCTSDSTSSAGKADFRQSVEQRDGTQCVLSLYRDMFCSATHLIPRSKGDRYISDLSAHFGDNLASIDDIRNGLWLNKMTQAGLGRDIAFLPTPNFAMTTADVDPAAEPTEERYTANIFDLEFKCALGGAEKGTPIRIADSPDWPPAFLFDTVYGTAVVHSFGTQTFKDYVSSTWGDIFYPDGIMRVSHAERRRRNKTYEDRIHKPRPFDNFDILLALPYILTPHPDIMGYFREQREKREQEEREQLEDKVETWRRQLADSDPSPE